MSGETAPPAAQPPETEEERHAREVSAAIDRQIEADRRKMLLERDDPRLLILGSGDSGKTTLLKQMRLFYGSGFGPDEVEHYRRLILENIVNSMAAFIRIADRLGREIACVAEKAHFLAYSHQGRTILPRDLLPVIATLWADPAILAAVPHGYKHHVQETAPYFLSRVATVGQPNYVPTNEDILHVRSPTLAVSETIFKIGIHNYHIYDVGGQRGLRKQWAPFFDNCHTVLFVTSLSSFDQNLEEEDKPFNRLQDAIELFGGVVNNQLLARAEIILFLNKKDIFEEKLKTIKFADHFPRYNGPNDHENISRYIAALYKAQRQNAERQVMIHRTCCTDTRNMEIVVARLIEGLTRSALARIGAL
ncbi:hypothetical protein HK105_205351 [Polyrhizophydium stewartii]|uniref:Uncharacterized protein n=1 Tax=Polyrhizophydium stewartii TaxID=2732419 RepID=A0ABR4N6C9_9FUNG